MVIEFSQTLLRSGTRAAFRLQAVRAVASYHRLVRQLIIPDPADVMQTLRRLAAQEQQFTAESRPGVADEPQLHGIIDPDKPPIIQKMRLEMRVQGLMLLTQTAYVGWVRRFLAGM
ncbi:MAG: hypothetical protein RIK87_18130 [Fuerstiella sp.]